MATKPRTPARYYEKSSWDNVTCKLCPHYCSIAPSRTGNCGVRTNRGGVLHVDNYARVSFVTAVNSERLPLFHFKPSLRWLRIGSKGCTMRCPFCNTFKFSQVGGVRSQPLDPQEIVQLAFQQNCGGISVGINEPAPMHEFVEDIFEEARKEGLETHLETGGMWNHVPFRDILPRVTAITFGLKTFDERFASSALGSSLPTVLGNIEMAAELGVHFEVTWVVIPGISDQPGGIREFGKFLDRLVLNPPVVLLPYEPDFIWAEESYPAATLEDLERVRQLLSDYPGAVYELHQDSIHLNTRCPECHRVLIRRGETGLIVSAKDSPDCPGCGAPVPYIV